MGFLSSIKKLFFASSSVAKHTIEKAGDFSKQQAEEILDKSKEVVSDVGKTVMDKTSGLRDAITDKSGDFIDKAKETIEDVTENLSENDFVQKAVEVSELVGKKALDIGEQLLDKAKDALSDEKENVQEMDDTPTDGTASDETDTDEDINIMDKAKEPLDENSKSDFVEGIKATGKNVTEKANELLDQTKEKITEVSDKLADNELIKKTAEITEKVGDKLLDVGETVYEKVTDEGNVLGEKLAQAGDELLDKTKSVGDTLSEKLSDVKDDMLEKAKEVSEKMSEKLDDTIRKAEDLAEAEKLNPKSEISDTNFSADGSLLEGTDDFFSSAEKYADGAYDAFSIGKITIHKEVDDNGKEKPLAKIAGMSDLDGDGNELVDDALLLDSDEEE